MAFWWITFRVRYAHLLTTDGFEMAAYEYVEPVTVGPPRSRLSKWQPPSVRFITDEEGLFKEYPETAQPYLRDSDFTMYKGAIVLNARAVRVLSPLMGDAVELLPLQCEEGEFWLLNVLQVLDCLDRERTVFTYWPDGDVKGASKIFFQAGCLEDRHIFRLPIHNYSRVYVSQAFKDLVDEHDLRGLRFELAQWETQTD
jgi:hypothetical protein